MCSVEYPAAFALLLTGLLTAPRLTAQPLPDVLEWELVGSGIPTGSDSLANTSGVGFIGDTLLASTESGTGMLAFLPDADEWVNFRIGSERFNNHEYGQIITHTLTTEEAAAEPGAEPGDEVLFLSPGLFRAGPGDIDWTDYQVPGLIYGNVPTPPTRGPGGALYIGTNAFGNGDSTVVRSFDGGRTWAVQPGYTGVYAYGFAFAEAVPEPPPGGLPGGAFVAADAFGLVYSHDGAATWTNVPGMSHRFRDIAAVEPGPRDGGRPGRILAPTFDQSVQRPRVFASDDGGVTWRLVFDGPDDGGFFYIHAAPDGAVYAYTQGRDRSRHLFGSADGGETWSDLGPVGADWKFGIEQIAVGPDGRLYVGGYDGTAGYVPDREEPIGGVFRTVEPVVLASAETPRPAASSNLTLRIFPNPIGASSGSLVLPVELPEEAEVMVEVVDLLGRRMQLVPAATYGAGAHALTLDVSALAPGTYVARVAAGARGGSAKFVVAE